MGFLDKLTSGFGKISDPFGDIAGFSGKTSAEASLESSKQQERLGREALGLLEPFQGIGEQGLAEAGFLTDPNAQFEFLQNNPLFAESLRNVNEQTTNIAAARGRLSAGDTLEQLSSNVLLSAAPLIQQQKGSIIDLLNFGQSTAAQQGGLLTGIGATQAAGTVGAANARAQGSQNVAQLAGTVAGLFSDPKLKINRIKTGEENGFTTWSWDWNELAFEKFGLSGSSFGVMADEVKQKSPSAIIMKDGFMTVNYKMIGVNHGS